MSDECKFPGGRPGAEANGRKYRDQPCGSDSLYERHGCRGPECQKRHTLKIAKQRRLKQQKRK